MKISDLQNFLPGGAGLRITDKRSDVLLLRRGLKTGLYDGVSELLP